jgi:hypothetical protein
VLKTIVQRAVQLTGLDGGAIYEYDEAEVFTLQAPTTVAEELSRRCGARPIRKAMADRAERSTLERVRCRTSSRRSYGAAARTILVRAAYRARPHRAAAAHEEHISVRAQ